MEQAFRLNRGDIDVGVFGCVAFGYRCRFGQRPFMRFLFAGFLLRGFGDRFDFAFGSRAFHFRLLFGLGRRRLVDGVGRFAR